MTKARTLLSAPSIRSSGKSRRLCLVAGFLGGRLAQVFRGQQCGGAGGQGHAQGVPGIVSTVFHTGGRKCLDRGAGLRRFVGLVWFVWRARMLADAIAALQPVAALAVTMAGLIFAFAGRVLALECIADTTRGSLAITIGTALAADIGRLAEAAEETIAAIVLTITARAGNLQNAAGISETLAAGVERNALAVATFLALAAVATADTIMAALAVAAFVIGAAAAGALAVAVVPIGAEVVARRAAMPVRADLCATLAVGATSAGHRGIAVAAILRAVLGAARARTACAIDTEVVTALAVGAAPAFHGGITVVTLLAVFGVWGTGSSLTRLTLPAFDGYTGTVAGAFVAAPAAVFGARTAAISARVVAQLSRFAIASVGNAGANLARFARPAITIYDTLDAIGVGGIARVVANRGASWAITIIAAFGARTALSWTAQLACWTAAIQLTGTIDTEPLGATVWLRTAVRRCFALRRRAADAHSTGTDIATAIAVAVTTPSVGFLGFPRMVAARWTRDVPRIGIAGLGACQAPSRTGDGERTGTSEQHPEDAPSVGSFA